MIFYPQVAKTCDSDLAISPPCLHSESNLTENCHSIDNNSAEDDVISQEIASQILTVTSADAQVQVTSGDIVVPFVSLIDTPKKLNTMTGIPTFEILNHIIYLFLKENPDTRCHRLSVKERLILVFIKLKQDLSFAVLAILFKAVSGETCRALYNSFIPLLANILRPFIYWPSKTKIISNIPRCFQNFKETRVILDCTEISVQSPKCLSCRIKLYSNYKGTFTFKFLVGISPGGLITYISKPYGGRASDKIIFEQSGLVNKMSKFDAVMVDKGFLIDTICDSQSIKVIRPPFLRNKNKFTKEESLLTKNIAKARVHIERVNQRLKTFKVLQNKFPWAHAHLMDDIITIIGGICNLCVPIFAEDKFNDV